MDVPAYCVVNKVASASSITSDTEDPIYPLENLFDQIQAKPFRATDPEDLYIEFALGFNLNFVAILNHNFSGGQTVTLKGGASPNPSTVIGTFPSWPDNLLLVFPAAFYGYLRIVVSDPGHTENLEIGELVIGHYITLPDAERYGGVHARHNEAVLVETEKGVRYVYEQFSRRQKKLPFRVTNDDIQALENLHVATHGAVLPFVYIPDISGNLVLYVRKEQNFEPKEIESPVVSNDELMACWDYTLELTEESSGRTITA
jgi:hypothetical protein